MKQKKASRRTKRKPSPYNLFVKKYMAAHLKKDHNNDVTKAMKAAAKEWSAQKKWILN